MNSDIRATIYQLDADKVEKVILEALAPYADGPIDKVLVNLKNLYAQCKTTRMPYREFLDEIDEVFSAGSTFNAIGNWTIAKLEMDIYVFVRLNKAKCGGVGLEKLMAEEIAKGRIGVIKSREAKVNSFAQMGL